MIIYVINETIGSCPQNSTQHIHMAHPSTTILTALFAITAIILAIFIMVKYNSVKVWDKSFSPLYISNTLWVIFYLALFARASCNTVRYAIGSHTEILYLSNVILQGIAAFSLSLTLNHQRKYRSSAPVQPANPNPSASVTAMPADKVPLVNPSLRSTETEWLKAISFVEIIFSILFLIYLVFFYLAAAPIDERKPIYQAVFLGAFILQRLPIIAMAVAIAVQHTLEGPTIGSRVVLLLAVVFYLVNDLPGVVLSKLPNNCPFYIASWADSFIILNFVSVILFFFFIRWEFLRNMEEVIWDKVNQIQTTFDFRRF